jgi:hypothetical protein
VVEVKRLPKRHAPAADDGASCNAVTARSDPDVPAGGNGPANLNGGSGPANLNGGQGCAERFMRLASARRLGVGGGRLGSAISGLMRPVECGGAIS